MTEKLSERLRDFADAQTAMAEPLSLHERETLNKAAAAIEAQAARIAELTRDLNERDSIASRTWNAIPDRFKLSPSDGGGYNPWDAIADMVAHIAEVETDLRRITSAALGGGDD